MIVVGQDQQFYYVPPQQNGPIQWQVGAAPPTPQIQLEQPTLGELIVDALGKLVIAGVALGGVYVGCELLFGTDERIMHCSHCGIANHTARNCPLTGRRTRLRIEKTGSCGCCGGRFRSTELHHYAGRGEERGKEMCGPCHLHCGHSGNWRNFPINPRYCRWAA